VDLRGEPAARAADGLVEPFFYAHRRYADGLARSSRRSSRIHCRDRPPRP
jgi:hypothetical protein